MKICWDILNKYNFHLTKNGLLRSGSRSYYVKECPKCKEEFIGEKDAKFCSISCSDSNRPNPNKGKKIHTEESRLKLSLSHTGEKNPFYGKHHTKETRKKLSDKGKKENNSNWKGGYNSKRIPLYDTYAHRIDYAEKCRKSPDDINILEVKCTYCGKWFQPTVSEICTRLEALEGKGRATAGTEYRLYCSDDCKKQCPVFRRRKYPLGFKESTAREVQPELRQLVFERDEYTCQKCEIRGGSLHCHHILPVATDPLLSADIDNCITLCKECHKEVHKLPGCSYGQLRICIEYA